MTAQRSAGVALLLIYLAAHLALLPRTLEDVDSINFALGVRDFDVARHQPHPPGYPVYIALGKASTEALRAVGVNAAPVRGLAVWSALAAAAALPALLLFFRRLEGRTTVSTAAMVVVALSPLFWVTAVRPLSDMVGFAAVMWVLAIALSPVKGSRRQLMMAALAAGLAVGIRSQTAVLTVPFLAYVLGSRPSTELAAGRMRVALECAGAFAAGCVAWGVPLLVASGGFSAYLDALRFQGSADFEGVSMLWTQHTKRDVLEALLNTFVWPWDWWPGIAVCVLAACGAVRLIVRAPRAAIALLAAFGPYAVFHLLFHETITTRYALPLLPVLAYAATAALEGLPGKTLHAAAIGLGAMSLLVALPAASHYAREGAPVFRAFEDMQVTASTGNIVDVIALHAGARRAAEWSAPILPSRVATAPHGREWLTLVSLWRESPAARVWFVADPRRTDLALFDGRARELARAYDWGFEERPFVGGARPGAVSWYAMKPPNWMLDRGWSLTAEVGGVTAREKQGPHAAPAIAWLRQQPLEQTVIVGGRHIGAGTASITVRLNGAPLETFAAPSGFFTRTYALPAGSLQAATPYVPLELTSTGEVSLEQFDAQPPGVPMMAFKTGWQEPEFDRRLGRAWRWASEKAELWVRPIGRPVTLAVSGENPMRYFDTPPRLRVLIGDREVAAFDLASDFDQTITLAPELLEAAAGRVVLESSKFFVPGGPGGGGDQRHLALRMFAVSVD